MSAVRERPILFSGAMIRAILDGRKTMTRRVCKPAEAEALSFVVDCGNGRWGDEEGSVQFPCPYGQPGDRLWVKETFIHEPADYCWEASVSIPCRPASTVYRADCDGETRGGGWTSPLFMPRNLSRITLEVTEVRVERLQAISARDAWAEGIPASPDVDPSHEFRELWASINGAGSWDANPWVWAISFRRLP